MKICMDDILLEVSNYYGYPMKKILERTNQRHSALLRQVCIYLARQLTNLSVSELRDYFDYGDKEAVMYCLERISVLKEREANEKIKTKSTISYDLFFLESKLSGVYDAAIEKSEYHE